MPLLRQKSGSCHRKRWTAARFLCISDSVSVGIRLLHCVPTLIDFAAVWFFGLDPLLGLLLLCGYYLIIGFGLSRFITASYTNAVFDQYINPRIEGAKVNQGLRERDEEDDEDEAEPEEDREEN